MYENLVTFPFGQFSYQYQWNRFTLDRPIVLAYSSLRTYDSEVGSNEKFC